jgi:hypothetical protein
MPTFSPFSFRLKNNDDGVVHNEDLSLTPEDTVEIKAQKLRSILK